MRERNSIVIEEYLQALYSLLEMQEVVKSVHLKERLQSSPSTIHATLSRMQRDELIWMDEKKNIQFTAEGFRRAEALTRRHRLVEYFLCDTLGIPWHQAHEHAHVLEHGLTDLVEQRLYEFLGSPKFCPHGTPLPGEENRLPSAMRPLTQLSPGQRFEVVMIEETLEEDLSLLQYLQEQGIIPGEELHLLGLTPQVTLQGKAGQAMLESAVADKIGVIPL